MARSLRRSDATVEIDVDAADATSALRRAEHLVDAGNWTPLEAQDGVAGSRRERLPARPDGLASGEHLVVFRVYDAATNAGLAKVVLSR